MQSVFGIENSEEESEITSFAKSLPNSEEIKL
jgi:hypothetical protein